jgi:membrane protein YqaA with SNARE-associated domain
MVALSEHSLITLFTVASVGNILGSLLNYGLGRYALRFGSRKWFPVSVDHLAKAQKWFTKWGNFSVLLAWVPIIGDPITVAAGVMKMNFALFTFLVTLSKTTRYAVLLGLVNLLN